NKVIASCSQEISQAGEIVSCWFNAKYDVGFPLIFLNAGSPLQQKLKAMYTIVNEHPLTKFHSQIILTTCNMLVFCDINAYKHGRWCDLRYLLILVIIQFESSLVVINFEINNVDTPYYTKRALFVSNLKVA